MILYKIICCLLLSTRQSLELEDKNVCVRHIIKMNWSMTVDTISYKIMLNYDDLEQNKNALNLNFVKHTKRNNNILISSSYHKNYCSLLSTDQSLKIKYKSLCKKNYISMGV